MDEAPHIFLVEDDQKLSNLITEYLVNQDLVITQIFRGDEAVSRIISANPDLVILDIMLPGLDGISVCREVRSEYTGAILMLTAKEDDIDEVLGLETGADDYVKKPVLPRVLLARIKALLRRQNSLGMKSDKVEESGGLITFGQLHIIKNSRRVTLAQNTINLSSLEYDLLIFLSGNAGRTVDRDELYIVVKGHGYDGLDRSIDVAISRLRKKIGDDPQDPFRIKTVWGKGYLFVPDAWD